MTSALGERDVTVCTDGRVLGPSGDVFDACGTRYPLATSLDGAVLCDAVAPYVVGADGVRRPVADPTFDSAAVLAARAHPAGGFFALVAAAPHRVNTAY